MCCYIRYVSDYGICDMNEINTIHVSFQPRHTHTHTHRLLYTRNSAQQHQQELQKQQELPIWPFSLPPPDHMQLTSRRENCYTGLMSLNVGGEGVAADVDFSSTHKIYLQNSKNMQAVNLLFIDFPLFCPANLIQFILKKSFNSFFILYVTIYSILLRQP